MRKNIAIAAICMLALAPATAQNISYVLSSVSEPVKKNAHTITRYENQVFEVADIDKATLNIHRVVTVVDSKGSNAQYFAQHTTKGVILDDVEIKVYDATGKQVNKYRKKDMRTNGFGDGLVEEGYFVYFYIPAPSYPFTFEVKYEMKFRGTLFLPDFNILSPGEGVEISTFTARVPKDLDIRFQEKNINIKPEVTEDAKSKVYKWTVKNLSPMEYEEGAVYKHSFPYIQLAPTKFAHYGTMGDCSSWQSIGMWGHALYKDLDELSEERKVFFRDLVKDVPDKRQKIKILYEYLQKNCRYVSIQLGIGGWKPFPASFTDNKKYGDCKGLSTYMRAILKAVDIKSYPALINREINGTSADPSFATPRFNHVILCVPQEKDTIWLECTSNTAEFGVLGPDNENRNALLITESGGVLVPTPASIPGYYRTNAVTSISLKEDGSAETQTIFQANGIQREIFEHFLSEPKDKQKEYFVQDLGFKQPYDFEFKKKESSGKHTTVLNMGIEKVPEFTAGSKMFVSPRIYKFYSRKLPKSDNRKLDYYFISPFEQIDTTIIQLPEGFTMDALPNGKELKCKYAEYSTKYWFDEQKKAIYSTATLVLNQQKIPAADYAAVKKFFDDILLDDAQRVVVKKL